jgi:hypothetical protein
MSLLFVAKKQSLHKEMPEKISKSTADIVEYGIEKKTKIFASVLKR